MRGWVGGVTLGAKVKTCRTQREKLITNKERHVPLKGLGHAILGNFSTDQIVVELTKI